MLRLETETGWWLVTHPDHARLAGAFAERWGNDLFLPPEPREHVLRGIARHDDGWAARDAAPQITRQGKPSAFSTELVGKYSGFEEIDLPDYLAVRDRAVRQIAAEDPYAAILISMHTYSLLNDHADRSTIAPEQLPLARSIPGRAEGAAGFLAQANCSRIPKLKPEHKSDECNFGSFPFAAGQRLSLTAHLRGFSKARGTAARAAGAWRQAVPVQARAMGTRHFVLEPYPFR